MFFFVLAAITFSLSHNLLNSHLKSFLLFLYSHIYTYICKYILSSVYILKIQITLVVSIYIICKWNIQNRVTSNEKGDEREWLCFDLILVLSRLCIMERWKEFRWDRLEIMQRGSKGDLGEDRWKWKWVSREKVNRNLWRHRRSSLQTIWKMNHFQSQVWGIIFWIGILQ